METRIYFWRKCAILELTIQSLRYHKDDLSVSVETLKKLEYWNSRNQAIVIFGDFDIENWLRAQKLENSSFCIHCQNTEVCAIKNTTEPEQLYWSKGKPWRDSSRINSNNNKWSKSEKILLASEM